MKKTVTLIFAILLACRLLPAQDGYAKKIFTSSTGYSLPYRSLDPENMKDGKKYPLILFLHGAGERGNDNEKQLIHGSQMFLNPVTREEFPAFVVIPQCPEEGFWAYRNPAKFDFDFMKAEPEETAEMATVVELVGSYIASGKVDPRRIYVMGLSMGGMATYDIILRHPDLFAAAIPICGSVDENRFTEKPSVKIRIYHGNKDSVVPVQCSRRVYDKLKFLGAKVGYKEFVGCDHNSWDPAFNEPDFLKWLFKQHR